MIFRYKTSVVTAADSLTNGERTAHDGTSPGGDAMSAEYITQIHGAALIDYLCYSANVSDNSTGMQFTNVQLM